MGTERTILHSFTPQGVSSEVGITVDPKFPADQVSVAHSDDWLGHTGHLGCLLSLASLPHPPTLLRIPNKPPTLKSLSHGIYF